MSRIARFATCLLAGLILCFSGLALADPPGRVGRLALVENGVNFRVDRNSPGEPASLNWPITQGAVLDSLPGARAEIWIGSTAFRLAGGSDLEFARLDDERIVAHLGAGSLAVSIMDREQAADLTVMTPDGGVRFSMPGRYRIDVLADQSVLIVQAGQAEADDTHWKQRVWAGQQAELRLDKRLRIEPIRRVDTFDTWVAERENAGVATTARQYVSPQMTGYQDLDAYGDWRPAPDYGTVWYPRDVAPDWAPYRYGRWAWVPPWGWTWIDQAPWGFAPFHYGRWALIGNRWAWVPGRHEIRPVYAPALVGWVGNPGWNVNFSFGAAPAVGWFPLAPREVYIPSYRHSATYIQQVNITHVHDVRIIDRAGRPDWRDRHIYRDRPQAVTVVPASMVQEGRPIDPNQLGRPGSRELAGAPQAGNPRGSHWLPPARQPQDGQRTPGASPVQTNGPGAVRGPGGEERPLPPGIRRLDPGNQPSAGERNTYLPRPVQGGAATAPPEVRREGPPVGGERSTYLPRPVPSAPTPQAMSPVQRQNEAPMPSRQAAPATIPPSAFTPEVRREGPPVGGERNTYLPRPVPGAPPPQAQPATPPPLPPQVQRQLEALRQSPPPMQQPMPVPEMRREAPPIQSERQTVLPRPAPPPVTVPPPAPMPRPVEIQAPVRQAPPVMMPPPQAAPPLPRPPEPPPAIRQGPPVGGERSTFLPRPSPPPDGQKRDERERRDERGPR